MFVALKKYVLPSIVAAKVNAKLSVESWLMLNTGVKFSPLGSMAAVKLAGCASIISVIVKFLLDVVELDSFVKAVAFIIHVPAGLSTKKVEFHLASVIPYLVPF